MYWVSLLALSQSFIQDVVTGILLQGHWSSSHHKNGSCWNALQCSCISPYFLHLPRCFSLLSSPSHEKWLKPLTIVVYYTTLKYPLNYGFHLTLDTWVLELLHKAFFQLQPPVRSIHPFWSRHLFDHFDSSSYSHTLLWQNSASPVFSHITLVENKFQ